MLAQHRRAIEALPSGVQRAVACGLGLPFYPGAFYEALEAAGTYQCDLILALLREDTKESLATAELILGRPVTRCPPGQRVLPERVGFQAGIDRVLDIIGRVDRGDAAKVAWVGPNVQLPTTDSWHRFRLLRVGMSVGQYVVRGGWRRDVREWGEAGKLRLA